MVQGLWRRLVAAIIALQLSEQSFHFIDRSLGTRLCRKVAPVGSAECFRGRERRQGWIGAQVMAAPRACGLGELSRALGKPPHLIQCKSD